MPGLGTARVLLAQPWMGRRRLLLAQPRMGRMPDLLKICRLPVPVQSARKRTKPLSPQAPPQEFLALKTFHFAPVKREPAGVGGGSDVHRFEGCWTFTVRHGQ